MTAATMPPTVDLGACQSCEQEPAVGVCSCRLGQPISLAYGARCLRDGIEAYWVIVATIGACIEDALGHPHPATEALVRDLLHPWALEIIDRSLPRHGKTWADIETDLAPETKVSP